MFRLELHHYNILVFIVKAFTRRHTTSESEHALAPLTTAPRPIYWALSYLAEQCRSNVSQGHLDMSAL